MTANTAIREKLRGSIKTIKRAEGFGFATHVASGTDYFFHRSAVVDGQFDELEIDQAVEFIPTEGPKGSRALEVRPL